MSDTNKEERELFFKKVFALLESTLLNEWVSSSKEDVLDAMLA